MSQPDQNPFDAPKEQIEAIKQTQSEKLGFWQITGSWLMHMASLFVSLIAIGIGSELGIAGIVFLIGVPLICWGFAYVNKRWILRNAVIFGKCDMRDWVYTIVFGLVSVAILIAFTTFCFPLGLASLMIWNDEKWILISVVLALSITHPIYYWLTWLATKRKLNTDDQSNDENRVES